MGWIVTGNKNIFHESHWLISVSFRVFFLLSSLSPPLLFVLPILFLFFILSFSLSAYHFLYPISFIPTLMTNCIAPFLASIFSFFILQISFLYIIWNFVNQWSLISVAQILFGMVMYMVKHSEVQEIMQVKKLTLPLLTTTKCQ